jgi:hypothetical protein
MPLRHIRWPLADRELPPLVFRPVRRPAADPPALGADAMARILDRFVQALPLDGIRSVGITVGSRGLRDGPFVVDRLVRLLAARGVAAHLIPAMGSHGGGTASGRRAVLTDLGYPPPFLDSDEVRPLAPGLVWTAAAFAVDRILVVNRVKPHTSFHGEVESGLVKMLVVGLGGPAGARAFHARPPDELGPALVELGRRALASGRVLGGVALVENGAGETSHLVPMAPEAILAGEAELLRLARRMLPRLPTDELDALVVRRMGKNLSGTGLDTNVIGRTGVPGLAVPDAPRINRIVVLDLTDESHGNANGVGLADFITAHLYRKIDAGATYLNSLTTGFLERARLPLVLPDARRALLAALLTSGATEAPRVMVIDDTLHIETVFATPATRVQGEAGPLHRPVFRRHDIGFRPLAGGSSAR